jgi:diacylglycerol kinase (ATP)
MNSGCLIFNPASGRGDKTAIARRLVDALGRFGAQVELLPTRRPGDVGQRAEQAVRGGAKFVAVLGGDGSIREAGEALLGTTIPLLILPAGTSNVLARSLGIPLDPLKAVRLMAEGRTAALDGGMANGNPFFFMCGAGIDAEVMGALNLPAKKILGRASFYPAILKLLATYAFPDLAITADGEALSGGYAVVTNIPHYAGKYILVPGADPFDGVLDLVVFKARTRMAFLKLYLYLCRATLLELAGVEHRKVRHIRIETSGGGARYQLDGDTMGPVPVEVEVLPAALQVLVPPAAAPDA